MQKGGKFSSSANCCSSIESFSKDAHGSNLKMISISGSLNFVNQYLSLEEHERKAEETECWRFTQPLWAEPEGV